MKIKLKYNSYFNTSHIIFLIFFSILLVFISLNSNHVEIYDTKWFYVSTPIGLFHSLLGVDSELSNWFDYLLNQEPVEVTSISNILLSIFTILCSTLFIHVKKREVFKKC